MIRTNIFNETKYKFIPRKKIKDIIQKIMSDKNISESIINIIFLNNNELKKINLEFLKHNYETDVISFTIEEIPLESEIYISIEKAEEQAKEYKVSLTNELLRLVIHGVLHTLGYDDDNQVKKDIMHKLEDNYIKFVLNKTN